MPASKRLVAARTLLATTPFVMRTVGRAMRDHASPTRPLLPQQYRLLAAIGRCQRTLGQVACIQGVTPATATTLVTTLETRGWVTRQHDPDDRRRVVVSLTDGGEIMLARSQRIAEDAMAARLESLTDDQLSRLLDGLTVLNQLATADSPF